MGRVDFHIHSTASDGVRTPREIMDMARQRSLSMISITDHDTMDGLLEGEESAMDTDVHFVPGIEFSVDLDPGGLTAHLLAYFPGSDSGTLLKGHTPLTEAIDFVQGGRSRRNPRILEKLRASGVYILMNEVHELCDGDVVGRPHIAEAMVNAGYVRSMKEAFNRFLGKGRPAYVERDRLPVERAIDVIKAAGGLPVMAHPGYIPLECDVLRSLFYRLKELGLAGVEVYYPTHSRTMVQRLESLAGELGLLMTGGTDYHGRDNEAATLGGTEEGFHIEMEQVSGFVNLCMESSREVANGKTQ